MKNHNNHKSSYLNLKRIIGQLYPYCKPGLIIAFLLWLILVLMGVFMTLSSGRDFPWVMNGIVLFYIFFAWLIYITSKDPGTKIN
jgi:hypothetical protein